MNNPVCFVCLPSSTSINKKAVNAINKSAFRHPVKENQLFKNYVILLIKRRAYLEASHQVTSISSTSSSISVSICMFWSIFRWLSQCRCMPCIRTCMALQNTEHTFHGVKTVLQSSYVAGASPQSRIGDSRLFWIKLCFSDVALLQFDEAENGSMIFLVFNDEVSSANISAGKKNPYISSNTKILTK